MTLLNRTLKLAIATGCFLLPASAHAAEVTLSLKNHVFSPAEVSVQAGQPVSLVINNLDSTPAEFESKTLRVEKVVAGKARVAVQIRPLSPGRYRFFDDYHEDTAEGFLVAR
ncbi:Cupredoxin-like domain-containing protein (fragment) (plasmid) [Beijerinckiaceae bacterium RH AL1]